MSDVYEDLRDRLDGMATGYPAAAGGVELRLLRSLFSPEDAAMFLSLQIRPESAGHIAARTGGDAVAVAALLEDMAKRGLIFRMRGEGGPFYNAVPFIVGIYEFQVNRLDQRMLRDVSEYYLSGLGQSFHSARTPHLRTVPVSTGLVSALPIAPYDDAVAIVERKGRIAVAQCLCRKAVRMYGKGCSHPLETCLQFDSYAEYYIDNQMARPISSDEAVAILRNNEKEGLVIQALNSQNVEAMCSCCSCCCGMLISLKLFPAPAREVKSNYVCAGDSGPCRGCGLCEQRCPVGAVRIKDGKASTRQERCIGCGLCVSTCPEQARTLVRKSPDRLYQPPESFLEAFIQMSEERGRKP
jgi:ferredoxin